MNDIVNSETAAAISAASAKPTGLALLRTPFPDHQVNLLPKPYKKDSDRGKCIECGGYHGLPAAHLSYVGHAALTDRLLDVDPGWNWEPLATDENGLPRLDKHGGMWIKLTVCSVTRLGYGDAQNRPGADGVKEQIGDALRNAAMRFGAALEFWHKGQLHIDLDDEPPPGGATGQQPAQPAPKKPADEKTLPSYSNEEFQKKLKVWQDLVKTGGKTADAIIKTVKSKYSLTAEQEKAIRSAPVPQQVPDSADGNPPAKPAGSGAEDSR